MILHKVSFPNTILMAELQAILKLMSDNCLSFIRDNIDKIDNRTYLFADFRANAKEWKIITSPKDPNHIMPTFPSSNPHNDKKRVYFIYLLNDGVLEGFLYLLPPLIDKGKLNYGLLLMQGTQNINEYGHIINDFESYPGHPLHK